MYLFKLPSELYLLPATFELTTRLPMLALSPEATYACLVRLDTSRDDAQSQVENAQCRESAIALLADHDVSLQWRQTIADRLNAADTMLGMTVIGHNDDSY
jgi:hypothetical protein